MPYFLQGLSLQFLKYYIQILTIHRYRVIQHTCEIFEMESKISPNEETLTRKHCLRTERNNELRNNKRVLFIAHPLNHGHFSKIIYLLKLKFKRSLYHSYRVSLKVWDPLVISFMAFSKLPINPFRRYPGGRGLLRHTINYLLSYSYNCTVYTSVTHIFAAIRVGPPFCNGSHL